MKKIAVVILLAIAFFISSQTRAKENVNFTSPRTAPGNPVVFAGCSPSTAKTELNFNNVRTIILINGDMWWSLNQSPGQYYIPKASGKSSLFAGALWIGGKDAGSNLRVAAQTYRQSGSDFWPGPLDINSVDITQDQCAKYDKHYKVHRSEVEDFLANAGSPGYVIPDAIKNWPGNGDAALNQDHFLAPYYDSNGDNEYNADDGDFPEYYFAKLPNGKPPGIDPCSKDILLGDETLWWVFNDKGNTHTETNSPNPIGLEIRAQAFAFATNDEINNMTFYRYKIINRNTTTRLDKCYFGQWVDADLGYYLDDYVGCDVTRGFGYCYNGDENDEGAAGYGVNPPAIGVDFFQGPTADTSDGIDNDRDGCIDCTFDKASNPISDKVLPEQIIMSKFVYYNNNSNNVNGNPGNYQDYYRYLQGIWRNGQRMTYGGNGAGAGTDFTMDTCDFMFPGDSDPNNYGTFGVQPAKQWTEVAAGNLPDDRRFLQSAGPFTLMPGAVNYITTGAVWARATNGGVKASVQLLRQSDDFAQALFDNCFRVLNGPDAPDMAIREMNNELICSLTNDNPIRNNYKEIYTEKDPNISTASLYVFEGYQVFQLKDETVTSTDLQDPGKARLVQQFDIKNGVTQIINFNFDAQLGAWNGYEAVNGTDGGLRHTFRINEDLFASGNRTLINHKTYYYMVVAYAFNPDESPQDPYFPAGRNKPYLSGRNNIKVYTAIPHSIAPESGGVVLNSDYGSGPEITRIEGSGNGYIAGSGRLAPDFKSTDDINSDQVAELLTAPYIIKHPTYAASRGPVDIRVYDPVKIVGGDFELWETVRSDSDTISNWALHDSITWYDSSVTVGKLVYIDTIWKLKNLNTGYIDSSDKTMKSPYDQVFSKYGYYVNFAQTKPIGNIEVIANGAGYIESSVVYQDSKRKWLGGVNDVDKVAERDWIASGKDNDNVYGFPSGNGIFDADGVWEKLIGGTWAPYKFTRANNVSFPLSVGFQQPLSIGYNNEADISSVDIVFTSDKSKWSKCVVIEEQTDYKKAVGGSDVGVKKPFQGFLRRSPSLDINGNVTGVDSGYSYFPGYAVNVNTGERLNIAFGENSYFQPDSGFVGQTGGDMKWNPTANLTAKNTIVKNYLGGDSIFNVNGGVHAIYVFGHVDNRTAFGENVNRWMYAYDEGKELHRRLNAAIPPPPTTSYLAMGRPTWATCMWVGYPKLNSGQSLLSNDVRIRLRVSTPYKKFAPDSANVVNDTLPKYTFSTGSLVATKGDVSAAKSALDMINVVPNPYYAYSSYEKNQIEHKVKIVNLPSKCKVTIFSPSGMLIRRLNRDVSGLTPANGFEGTSDGTAYPTKNLETSVDWDLKNEVGIPVASGIYIIHVEAAGVGEKTIKLFAVQRPIDLDTF